MTPLPPENITEKYRTCSCHFYVGVVKIFEGCKWKSSEIQPDNLRINDESKFFEASGDEQPIMLFDVEEAEQTSDISQIFTGLFLNCLRALPGQAEIICRLEESTRPCEITCGEETDPNVCMCDKEGCFWRNLFNRNCNSFEEPVHHEEAIREIETVHHEESALSKLKFKEMKND